MLEERETRAADAIERIKYNDVTLTSVFLNSRRNTDADLAALFDCLIAHPNVIKHLALCHTRMSDETISTLARYLAISTTIEWLTVSHALVQKSFSVLAAALRLNSSLRRLRMCCNSLTDTRSVDEALVAALRFNPARPPHSKWALYTKANEFRRLKAAADALGPPSMLEQLRQSDRT